MDISKKSVTALVVVVLIAGSALAISGVNLSGDFMKGQIPDWCIKYPVVSPYSAESGSSTPSPTRGLSQSLPGYAWRNATPGSMIPGSRRAPDISMQLRSPLKDIAYKKVKDLDKPLTSEIGSSTSGSTSRGSQGTVRKGGTDVAIPGVSIPDLPGGVTPGGNTPSQEAKGGDPWWSQQIVCPEGYHPDYDLFNTTCPHIKKALESGLFTEATLPPDMKKLLPMCKRWGSWFSVPKMSDADCEALFAAQMSGEMVDQSKIAYCNWMKDPGLYDKTYNKLKNQCVNVKKSGGALDSKLKKFCEQNIWWWKMKNTPSEDECKKISSAMSDYKKAGGNYCDLPMGDSSQYCSQVFSETMPSDYIACGNGG